jgi:hypothetical protein
MWDGVEWLNIALPQGIQTPLTLDGKLGVEVETNRAPAGNRTPLRQILASLNTD